MAALLNLVITGVAHRRPQDLVVGPVGCCEVHRWPTAWRTPSGALWCERCWWQTFAGRAFVQYLKDRPREAGEAP